MSDRVSPPQAEVIGQGLLTSGFNCILQMPTGSGKTWLAEQAIADVLAKGYRAIYLSPLRALATELAEQWQQRFAGYRIGVFTGDYGIPGRPYPVPFGDAQLLVMTPERLDACTRAWRTHWHWLPDVDLVVVDEFHLLGEAQRGARLEGTLLRVRRLNPFVRILGLSATLGNRTELADWLDGVDYISDWRPIPLQWRVVRYRQAGDKPDLLVHEVRRNLEAGGKSLVFVQSRRRAEVLSRHLCNAGIVADHHHAGLSNAERQKIERSFRQQGVDVLVATSTLEMGINMPVRQVVLYDLQAFDGSDFRPLSTNTVWQRAGRAGRRGLDREGEAVLLAPTWDNSADRYAGGSFEAIRSGLQASAALAEQVVAEVASGLSRTGPQLRSTFSQSLAAYQNRLPDVDALVMDMCNAGMVCEKRAENHGVTQIMLAATRLGRIATRHFLAPATVLLFKRLLDGQENLAFFDLLLLAAASLDCEPVLPVDYEELESVADALAQEPSYLLQEPRQKLTELLGVDGKRLLAALKMALVLRAWTRVGEDARVAAQYDCYPFEVRRLQESMERLLLAMAAVLEPEETTADPAVIDADFVEHKERIGALRTMVAAGLDETAVTLTVIPGLGPAYAHRLYVAGMIDIEALAQAEPSELAHVRGVSLQRASQWIEEAAKIVRTHSAHRYRELGPYLRRQPAGWPAAVDPYRLRRALDLTVRGADGGDYAVSGGLEPHRVHAVQGGYQCDCLDAKRGHLCNHVLAVRLSRGDRTLKRLVDQLESFRSEEQIDLLDLWLSKIQSQG